jgi:serine/threonine-protein kinase
VSTADPRVGTVVAGCRIDERLRPGGMSVVYLAEHLHLGRKVALKLLDARLAQDEDYRKRFIRESRLAAGLYHPNIVPIYDAGEADGVPYIMMHFVQGSDLSETIAEEGPLPPERVLTVMGQVTSALDAAHDRGLVHRDVKPANILIASGDGPEPVGHVYLTDFGLAKQVESGTRLTRAGLFMGTLDYVAPEQIQGQGVDRRADVYSLGCVIYECLTGAPPFQRESEVAMMYAHIQEDPPKTSERRTELPTALDSVVARAMAKDAEERWGSCGELLEALREVLEEPAREPTPEAAAAARARTAEGQAMPAEPEAAPPSPALEMVVDLDYQGERFGLGRTQDRYAVWDLHTGGPPLATFPLEAASWQMAWDTYQDLESNPDRDRKTTAESRASVDEEHRRPSGPGGPLLVGVVFLDYRGQKYALGRTDDGYAIWDLLQGGAPLRQFPLSPEAWQDAWGTYQSWESGESRIAEGAQEVVAGPPGEPDLAGATSIDYRGAGYALGRISTGYALWDLRVGGPPILTFPLTAEAWQQAWQSYQQLEQRVGTR